MTAYLGEMAALATALCWSFSSIFYTLAGRQVGPATINRLRLLLSIVFLGLAHRLLLDSLLPAARPEQWFWLGVSGIVGLSLGDTWLFQAYIWIGPRLAMLLKSLAPVFSALLAWLFLAETLAPVQIAGIFLTVGGVSWVVLERSPAPAGNPGHNRRYLWGLLFGVGAALTQAVGLITAKLGLSGDIPALSGHLMRMLAATAAMWGVTIWQRQAGAAIRQMAGRPQTSLNLTAGTVLGPVVGVWFSLVAVRLAHVGIASTLMALVPIFLLPIGRFVLKERISRRAVAGTVVAVAGVALLFWPG